MNWGLATISCGSELGLNDPSTLPPGVDPAVYGEALDCCSYDVDYGEQNCRTVLAEQCNPELPENVGGITTVQDGYPREFVCISIDGEIPQVGDSFLDADGIMLYGCTETSACNYNTLLGPYYQFGNNEEDCDYGCYGCMDEVATNYDPNATTNDPTSPGYVPCKFVAVTVP